MTKIDAESLPAMGTKLNLTACPGPTLTTCYADDKDCYVNCAYVAGRWGDVGMIAEALAVVENSRFYVKVCHG